MSRHGRPVLGLNPEGWRLLGLWWRGHRRTFWTWALGIMGLLGVWLGLLLVANAEGWPAGTLIILGVVSSVAWMFLYISEAGRPPRG